MLEYVRFVHVQDASNNLEKLAHLVPVLDYHGESYHIIAVRALLSLNCKKRQKH